MGKVKVQAKRRSKGMFSLSTPLELGQSVYSFDGRLTVLFKLGQLIKAFLR